MSIHLREHYGNSISPAHLGVILDLCDHQVDISDSEKEPCLLCGEELSLSTLQGHLAAHMEDLALFVLPSTNEEEETGGSRASVQAAKRQSKGTDSGTESEVSSLGYSAAGDYGQPPADFSKLLASEEEEYASKFSSWRTTDEDKESEYLNIELKPREDLDEDKESEYLKVVVRPEEDPGENPDEDPASGDLKVRLKTREELLVSRLEDQDEDVRRATIQTLGEQSDLPEEIFKIDLKHVNSLIEHLGEKKDYKNLLWLLSGFWNRRDQTNNSPGINYQLARRYILARYMTGDCMKAARLAEDISYNCRRVQGTLHSKTLEMSTLVSQLYTGFGQQLQKTNGGQHMAQRCLKKIAGIHENLLRIIVEPSLADLEGGLDGDLIPDGSNFDLDLSDDAEIAEGEQARQHLLLLKLALQRLGEWPKDYSEYKRLNDDLFRVFPTELQGVGDIDTWNLKDFGGGKASSNEDMLDLESISWGLDFSMEAEEVL